MKHNLNKNNKERNSVIATTFVTAPALLTIMIVVVTSVIILLQQLPAYAAIKDRQGNTFSEAPSVVSGDNIYIAWWTNNTENGNEEVMFRASNDGGATFGDKMNLSNTTDADSWAVNIAAEGESVLVSWWETNQTSDTPLARISTDAGETFGPMIMLATNGTITTTEEEGAEAEGGGEEAAAANGGG
jgi:hypothetical protein